MYDVTSVLGWHPGTTSRLVCRLVGIDYLVGGAEAFMPYAGKATVDTTSQVSSVHDPASLTTHLLRLQYKGIHDNCKPPDSALLDGIISCHF